MFKVTIKTPQWSHYCRSGVFIVNFEHISNLVLLFLLLTLNKQLAAGFQNQTTRFQFAWSLSSSFAEWSCAVVINTTQWRCNIQNLHSYYFLWFHFFSPDVNKNVTFNDDFLGKKQKRQTCSWFQINWKPYNPFSWTEFNCLGDAESLWGDSLIWSPKYTFDQPWQMKGWDDLEANWLKPLQEKSLKTKRSFALLWLFLDFQGFLLSP